jgi:hypothetical protein
MRAGPLSNPKVISLLNRYFVPVLADGVYIKNNDAVPAEEKATHQRIFQELFKFKKETEAKGGEKFSIGSVHVYILAPDGKPMASKHVGDAAGHVDRVIAMLEDAVKNLKTVAGKPLVAPRPQSTAPKAGPHSLVLHLTSHYLVPKGDPRARKDSAGEYVPIRNTGLGTDRHGDWSAIPSENWIVLSKAEWLKLLPAGEAPVGKSWDIDKDVASKLFVHFYPDSENNDATTNRIDQQALRATVVSVKEGTVRVKLAGSLKMKHTFYPRREDSNFVNAALAGYLDFSPDKKQIGAFRLVTDQATYGSPERTFHFGVAVRSVR